MVTLTFDLSRSTKVKSGQKPEPIELIFGMVVTLGPLDNVLDGGLSPPILGELGVGEFFLQWER